MQCRCRKVPFGLEGPTSLFRNSVRFALKKLSSPMPQMALCESSIVSSSVLPDLQIITTQAKGENIK